jgi:signal transduction histidine kinase
MVYGIVQDHNGFFDIRSEVGKGTSIAIYFPEAD